MQEHLFRALSELGFYYAFAAIPLCAMGSAMVWPALLLPCLCFMLGGWLLEKKRLLAARLLLVPMAAFFFLPLLSWADRIAYVPAAAYTAWLVLSGNAAPSRYRTIDVFSLFWKVYAGVGLALMLVSREEWLTAASLPVALVCCCASALLLRTLRHAPAMRRSLPVQALNAASIAAVLFAAWLLSTRQAIAAAAAVAGAVWRWLCAPILMGLAAIATVLVGWVYYVVRWLLALAGGRMNELNMNMENGNGVLEPVEEALGVTPDSILPLIAKGLAAAAAVVLVILLFRWLAGRRNPEPPMTAAGQSGTLPLSPPARRQPILPGTPAGRIRSQYRRFLRLCRQCGVTPAPSHTAQEIAQSTARLRPTQADEEALRALYLAARYGGQVTAVDAAQAKALFARIKEQMKPYTA